MQSNIQVKFLTKKEFREMRNEDSRYEHVDETNLGFSDKEKNRVYVRAGLDLELTKYLINHEIEHLYELEGTHEDEHGIRHKKGGFLGLLQHFVNPLNFPDLGPLSNTDKNFLDTSKNNQLTGAIGKGATGLGEAALFGPAAGGILNAFGQNQPASYQGQQGGLNSLFQGGQIPQVNQSSLGQGFGQTGSFTPGSQGAGGSSTMGLQQPGLGQAGIQFGQGAFGNQDQSQSGFFRPNYKF